MNYFYFFFFLSLSAIILFKPFAKSISDWIVKSDNLNKTGLITFFIGISLISYSLMQSFWYERMWMVITLVLGILLLIRSLFILFFIEKIKKNSAFIYKKLLQVHYSYFNNYGLFSLFNCHY